MLGEHARPVGSLITNTTKMETVNALRCAIKDWLIERFPHHDVTDDIVDHYLSVLIDEADNFDE